MGYRILMLDDSTEHVAALRAADNANCEQILAFSTVAQAMKWMDEKDHVDVIVSNAFLEKENVFEFLKAVKQNESHKWVQFIVICTQPSELESFLAKTVEKTAKILGADKYVMMTEFSAIRLLKEIEASLPNMLPQKDIDPMGDALGISRDPEEVPSDVNEAQKPGPKVKGRKTSPPLPES